MSFEQHPLSAAFPSMSEEDFLALKLDLRAHGQRDPIVIHEGKVLDGWHRYQALLELGMYVDKINFLGTDPAAFVTSKNAHRRHLTPSQRAAAAVAVAQWAEVGRPKVGEAASPFLTVTQMAEAAQVSERTIQQVKVASEAGLLDVVKEGAMTAEEAARVAKGYTEKRAPKKEAPKQEPVSTSPPQFVAPTDAEIEASQKFIQEQLKLLDAMCEADDKLKVIHEEVVKLRRENEALKAVRDGWMNQNKELIRQNKSLKKRLEALEAK